MPPFLSQPHFSNSLLIKRLLNRNGLTEPQSMSGNESASATTLTTILSTLSSTMSPPKTTTSQSYMKEGKEILETVAEKTHIPFWGVFLIFLVIVGVFVIVFYCCLQKWWRKLRGKDGKGGFMGGKVDLKSVQLLGQAYKEKV
jgi:synaptotagmin-1